MRFKIMRDNGTDFELDPMSSNLAVTLGNSLNKEELTVFGVAMLLVAEAVGNAAKHVRQNELERMARENPQQFLKELLKAGMPPVPPPSFTRNEAQEVQKSADEPESAGRGMYL